MTNTNTLRPISTIIREIRQTWPKPYFGAVPYLEALSQCQTADDRYMFETAGDMIPYLLGNMQTFTSKHNPNAKAIKEELTKHWKGQ